MRKKRMSKKQREWCKDYERQTGFEPMMDDFEAGNKTFYDCAQDSIQWFEDWSDDCIRAITWKVPGAY